MVTMIYFDNNDGGAGSRGDAQVDSTMTPTTMFEFLEDGNGDSSGDG